MRSDEVRQLRGKRKTDTQKETQQKKEAATEAKVKFMTWLDSLRENRTLDRMAKRAAVWERAANMQELRLEAHRFVPTIDLNPVPYCAAHCVSVKYIDLVSFAGSTSPRPVRKSCWSAPTASTLSSRTSRSVYLTLYYRPSPFPQNSV